MDKILNRFTYKGKGRPRKTDYITVEEAQKILNKLMNDYLDNIKFKI